MMKLYEFEKSPSDMTTEELEEHMLLILDDINNILDTADARIEKEKNAATNRATGI